jgi:hypothetical protein
MILQGEAAEDEEDIAAPLGIVGGLEVKNDWNQVLDVLDCSSMALQVGNGLCFRGDGEVVAVHGGVVSELVGTEALVKGSGLLLQSVSVRTL